MTDVAKDKLQQTPAEKTGGPPSGVADHRDVSAMSGD